MPGCGSLVYTVLVMVPLAVEDYMEIGYITHKKIVPGHLGQKYIQLLQDHVRDWTEASSL